MSDVVSLGIDFDGNRAFKGMDTLRALLERTNASAKKNTAEISNSFSRLNNTPIRVRGLDQFTRDMERASDRTEASLREMRASIESFPKPVGRAQSAFLGFAGGLAAIGFTYVIEGIRDTGAAFTRLSDKASQVSAKLTLATSKFGDLAQANKDVVAISNRSRSDIGAVTDLYSTFARQAERLGISQAQVATATETVGKTLKISGADTAASAGAIRQLSQALASGVLRGDEFNSVYEASPRLMELVAEAAGKPVVALRKLAEEGKLTSDVLVKALTDPKLVAGIEKEFGKIPVTFGDISTAAGNMFTQIAGAFSKGFGIGDSLASSLANIQSFAAKNKATFVEIGKQAREVFTTIADAVAAAYKIISASVSFIRANMGTLKAVAIGAAAGFTFYRAAALLATVQTTAFGKAVAINSALVLSTARNVGIGAAAQVAFTGATAAATAGFRAFTAALLANPLGLIAVAISTVVSLMIGLSDATGEAAKAAKAKAKADELAADEAQRRAEFEMKLIEMTDAQKKATINAAKAALTKAKNDKIAAQEALNRAKAELELARALGKKQLALAMRSTAGAGSGYDPALGTISRNERREAPLEAEVRKQEERIASREREIKAQEDRIKAAEASLSKIDTGSTTVPAVVTDKASASTKKATNETDKYEDAVRNLNDRIKDLTLTEEQQALAGELERAGLGRDITQINAKANEIKRLFKILRDGEQAKKVSDILGEFNEKVRELSYSQEQLAQVEARRRAGLSTDLSVTNELTKQVDAQALAYYRLQKAKENAQTIKDIERDQQQRNQDIQFDELARTNPNKAEDERRIAQIQRERDANIRNLEQLEGITEAKRAELIANEQNLASLREQGVVLDRQAEGARALTDFLTNLWESPKQAFKSFIGDVLKGLVEAIAKAALLGEKLGGKGGIGGLLTSLVTGALGLGGGAVPGRASGGSVSANQWTLVGENGPEIMKFGAAGTIINASTTRKAMGMSGGNNITVGDTQIIIQGGAGADTQAQIAAQMAAYKRGLIAEIRAEMGKR